jgi:hypothetical protein
MSPAEEAQAPHLGDEQVLPFSQGARSTALRLADNLARDRGRIFVP